MNLKVILVFLGMLCLCACNLVRLEEHDQDTAIPVSEDYLTGELTFESQAQATLMDYFELLNEGKYDQAAALFGGSYEVLRGYNPLIDPEDRAGLLMAGCELNGLMCLKVLHVNVAQGGTPQDFAFDVAFVNPDGSQFILGPCCGESEENMPPQSTFTIRVSCENRTACQVMDLPPYVP